MGSIPMARSTFRWLTLACFVLGCDRALQLTELHAALLIEDTHLEDTLRSASSNGLVPTIAP
jgi:hypothetical protein